jgi:DNA-binding response OmpR family regulator
MAKVIVCEDQPLISNLLKRTLERHHHQVTLVTDGQKAVETISSEPFDLAILDIRIPTLNGFAVCEAIRANTTLSTLPVLALSAQTDAESRKKYSKAGFTAFAEKPFDLEEFYVLITRLLTESKHPKAP